MQYGVMVPECLNGVLHCWSVYRGGIEVWMVVLGWWSPVMGHGPDVTVPFVCGGWFVGWRMGGHGTWTGCHGSILVWGIGDGVVEGRWPDMLADG